MKGKVEGLNPDLINKLIEIEKKVKFELFINSGKRTEVENTKLLDAVPDSEHLTGDGADASAVEGYKKYKIIKAAIELGFTRIGVGRTFIHLGISKSKPQFVIWTYN